MRTIVLRYAGECRECGATLAVGASAVYERRVGVFCPDCGPTDPEDIRAYRQEAGDRRAEKYEGWAARRRERANATLDHNRKHYTGDIAFNTQPGHIPLRARVNAQDARAFESLQVAERFERKAKALRHVRVAGDAERKRQAKRDAVRPLLKVGMRVDTGIYGAGVVERINRKTATVGQTGTSGTYQVRVDLSWLRPLEEQAQGREVGSIL